MKTAIQKKVIALGFFDGVHLGHAALLKRVAQVAQDKGLLPAALTFDRHPGSALTGTAVPLLTTVDDRAALMERLYGIREEIVLPCGGGMLDTPWREFVTRFLVEEHQVAHVVAGEDFRFGRFGEGTVDKLRELCAQLGLGCDIIPKVKLDGITVSSTYIRKLVGAGELERANRFLGHPYGLTGRVEHGKKLGSRLGFPTVNLTPAPELLIPAHGVYAAKVWLLAGRAGSGEEERGPYLAVTNIGIRPTVDDGNAVTVESFLLDFDGDLYGQALRLELYHRLRSERAFDDLEELRAEISRNVAQARAYFEG